MQKSQSDPGEIASDGRFGVLGYIARSYRWYKRSKNPSPENEEGLKIRNHRSMVGGNWDLLGRLQFNFLVGNGLTTESVLLDLGCGSFRAGRFFINYLAPGNYLGMDKQAVLVREGRIHEIAAELWEQKHPEIVVSSDFDLSRFSKSPDVVLAQSLLTHLTKKDIRLCLKRVRKGIRSTGVMYASVCETQYPIYYSLPSHSSRDFYYTRNELEKLSSDTGWIMDYIGDWGHPHPFTKMIRLIPT